MMPVERVRICQRGFHRWIVRIFRRIEIDKVSVLLRQSSVPIETHARGDGEIGPQLKFILDVFAGFVRAPVPVRVSVQNEWFQRKDNRPQSSP